MRGTGRSHERRTRSISTPALPPPDRCARTGDRSYVPDAVVTNEHLHARFGFDSDWIVKRDRHPRAPPRLAPSGHQRPLLRGGASLHRPGRCQPRRHRPVDPRDLHARHVVSLHGRAWCKTSSSSSVRSRGRGGLRRFMYALITGCAYVASGASDLALVVAGDCNSRVVNPADVKTYPLFGDGAGAVLLARGRPDQGILSYSMGADGSGGDLLSRPACGSRLPPRRRFWTRACISCTWMAGRYFAGRRHPLRQYSGRARPRRLSPRRGTPYVPHQANIASSMPRRRAAHCAQPGFQQTSTATATPPPVRLPLALDEAAPGRTREGRQLVVLSGFGAASHGYCVDALVRQRCYV